MIVIFAYLTLPSLWPWHTDDIRKIPWKNDRILYQAFHDYLKSIFAVELVYCVRSIVVYQQLWTDKKKSGMNHTEGKVGDRDVHHEEKDEDPPSFDDAAWKIYSYFVASGSVYEVSVSSRRRREIQQHLATPTIDMFDRLQEQTYTAIGHHLDRFYTSNFFQSLPDVIRQEQIDQALRREMRQKMHHGTAIANTPSPFPRRCVLTQLLIHLLTLNQHRCLHTHTCMHCPTH